MAFQPRRPVIPTDDELAAAAKALRAFEDDEVAPVVETKVSATASTAPAGDPWSKLAEEFEPTEGAVDFSFMGRGPLALHGVDIPLELFEPFWCRVVLPNGQADTFSVADAKARHFRPVPRDMLPESVFTDDENKHLIGHLEGGFVRGGYCLMVRPRKVADMEARQNNVRARSQVEKVLSQFEKNVNVGALMQSRAPEMTFSNFRGRKAVADDD